jgi:hypothetical protein
VIVIGRVEAQSPQNVSLAYIRDLHLKSINPYSDSRMPSSALEKPAGDSLAGAAGEVAAYVFVESCLAVSAISAHWTERAD